MVAEWATVVGVVRGAGRVVGVVLVVVDCGTVVLVLGVVVVEVLGVVVGVVVVVVSPVPSGNCSPDAAGGAKVWPAR